MSTKNDSIEQVIAHLRRFNATWYHDLADRLQAILAAQQQAAAEPERIAKARKLLADHNRWRRGEEGVEQGDPKAIGEALDTLLAYTTPPPAAASVPEGETLFRRAFAQGWRVCAEWAQRDDLVHDIGSPRYEQDLSEAAVLSSKPTE